MQPARFSGTDTALVEMTLGARSGASQALPMSLQRQDRFIAPDYTSLVVTEDLWIDWLLRWSGELELAQPAFDELVARRARQREAANLLHAWMSEDPGGDEAVWSRLGPELACGRTTLRHEGIGE